MRRAVRHRVANPLYDPDRVVETQDGDPDPLVELEAPSGVRSWESVGEMMGMKPGTCQAVASRALRKLRLMLVHGMTHDEARRHLRKGHE
jgi:hypothetical protein